MERIYFSLRSPSDRLVAACRERGHPDPAPRRVLVAFEGRFLGYDKNGRSRGYAWPGEDLLLAAGWRRVQGDRDDGSPVAGYIRGHRGVTFGGPRILREAGAVYNGVEEFLAGGPTVQSRRLDDQEINERGALVIFRGAGPFMTGTWDEVIPPQS